ncbi:MAG: class I SAM-dependent methyltransferase [Candidatus Competibacteraceae bacterium]|nr:class I SAM-dependent methyltransferase [Candidatus Competibacteraceae bacterium]
MLRSYFKGLYQQTMTRAYSLAFETIAQSLDTAGQVFDCGANTGSSFQKLSTMMKLETSRYHGIEWNADCVAEARARGLNIVQGDLNRTLPFQDEQFSCVFALSVLEHLLSGCAFMKECHRVLQKNGTLVLLTPNISTFFTIALLLLGKMPSSGPHPDSNALLSQEELFKVSSKDLVHDAESETPVHRHLVVFSYRVLRRYLRIIGFSDIKGHGFGLYPFPNFLQPFLERIDPWHCHQMVFIARK